MCERNVMSGLLFCLQSLAERLLFRQTVEIIFNVLVLLFLNFSEAGQRCVTKSRVFQTWTHDRHCESKPTLLSEQLRTARGLSGLQSTE